ncbi:MAG: hypothetical protein FWE88_04160 [Phycisphaerae bacterium]|nr:hypothetical protein [Phycisphaerae bacterium]
MTAMLAAFTLFVHPMPLPSWALLVLLLPLCLAVAVIYKTVRTTNLRRLAGDVLLLFLYMLAGLALLMLVGYAIIAYV